MLIIEKVGFHFYLELKPSIFFLLQNKHCALYYRIEIQLFLAFWSWKQSQPEDTERKLKFFLQQGTPVLKY